MPIYEYSCGSCEHVFEEIQRFSDPDPEACPECGKGPVRRLISNTSFHLKGGGWYDTNYEKVPSTAPASTPAETSSETSSPTEAKPDVTAPTTETKTPKKASPTSSDAA
ncbi:MAG: FmdB family zinc ribbon protein [Bradymonadaceae bacterium]